MTRQILPVPNPVTSYWLSETHRHADLRSTPRLPGRCEIAVVGAGLAGVLSAYYILKHEDGEEGSGAWETHAEQEHEQGESKNEVEAKGPKVLLLDARQLCSGATGRNGGHVKVQVSTLLNLPGSAADGGKKRSDLHDYVNRVMHELKRVVDDEGIECEFELRRSFDVFTDAANAQTVYERFVTARRAGEKWTSNVSWIGAERAEQVTSIKGAKGAFSVPCASFWPYKFVTGLLEVMVRRWGAGGEGTLNVQMHTPVLSLSTSPSPSPSHILTTDRGAVSAAKLVLATNAYTAGLLPAFTSAIIPVRGMASHHSPSQPIHPHLSNTYNINSGPGRGVDYLNPRPDGGIVVGGGSWLFAPNEPSWKHNWDDAHLFPAHVNAYWTSYMHGRFLGWEGSGAVNDFVWTGIMGRTGDGQPFVGRVPERERMWVLAGFNGGGMAIIALCARAVGRMVLQDKGFDEVWEQEGLLEGFRCCEERLRG